MLAKIKELEERAKNKIINSADELENFRLQFLVKKGELNELIGNFRDVPKELKKEVGIELNKLKQLLNSKFQEAKEKLENQEEDQNNDFDKSLPGENIRTGSRHPISIVRNKSHR